MKETLKKLVTTCSVSGCEHDIAKLFCDEAKMLGLEVWTDEYHNGYAQLKSVKNKAPHIMISAHGDEVGLVVTGFTPEGFLRIADWSGVDHKVLPGSEVVVKGRKDIPAIIGILPPHLQKGDSKKTIPEKKLYADTGFEGNKIKELVKIGDHVLYKKRFEELKNDRIAACAIDDKIGLTILLETAKKCMKVKLDVMITFVCTSQEEIWAYGARRASWSLKPDLGIAIDVCPAEQYNESGPPDYVPFGKGASIAVGPTAQPKVIKSLKDAASRINLKLIENPFTRGSGTEADEVWGCGLGRPVAILEIPIRYLHQPVEVVDMHSVKECVNILTEFLTFLPEGLEEVFKNAIA